MALDPTARDANLKDSIKKHFVESLSGIYVTFDRSLDAPKIQGTELDRWMVVRFGAMVRKSMSARYIDLILCTRKDPEGYRLSQLSDSVFGACVDPDGGMVSIPMYRSYPNAAWERLDSTIVISEIQEAAEDDYDDLTKFKILTALLRWGAKV